MPVPTSSSCRPLLSPPISASALAGWRSPEEQLRLEAEDAALLRLVYETAIRELLLVRLTDAAVAVFHRMLGMGVEPSTRTIEGLMGALQKVQEPGRSTGKALLQAEHVIVQMMTQGAKSTRACNCMLSMYNRAGQAANSLSLLREMEACGVEMDLYTFHAALTAFSLAGNLDAAAELFKWLLQQHEGGSSSGGSAHVVSATTFTIMIGAYSRAQRLDEAAALLQEMERHGVAPDIGLFNRLLASLGQALLPEDVLQLYATLKEGGPVPVLNTYECVIVALGRTQRLQALVGVLKDARAAKCQLSESAFESALKACSKAIEQAETVNAIWEELRLQGWRPSARSVREVLAHYRKEMDMPAEVIRACEELSSDNIRLDEMTWQCLIGFYFRTGAHAKLVGAVAGLKADGHLPRLGVLTMMLDSLGLQGRVDEAEEVFAQIEAGGYQVDLVCFDTLMNAYAEAGCPEKALRLQVRMEDAGVALGPKTWTLLLKAHGKAGDTEGATEVYWSMRRANCPCDMILYNTAICVCGRALPLEETLRCYRAMVEAGCEPNRMTHNLVLTLLARNDHVQEAEVLFEKLQRQGHADPVTLAIMADAYGKRRRVEQLEELLGREEEQVAQPGPGTLLSVSAYNAMIDAYGKLTLYQRMEGAYRRLAAAGLKPDLTTFNSMLHAYGKGGLETELEATLERLHEAGLKPDVWTYNILIGAYGDLEMPAAALKVFHNMQSSKLAPDEITYNNLVRAFRRSGDFLEAARWSLWMKQAGFTQFPANAQEDGQNGGGDEEESGSEEGAHRQWGERKTEGGAKEQEDALTSSQWYGPAGHPPPSPGGAASYPLAPLLSLAAVLGGQES
eukprot:TRINITY_DN1738_c0_g1_i1.p1 TRINITY_DN1738_c0_g1~~TRINITY_DN1738_c0_g1_i1.p1  ORF type:complete len:850 (-),score=254.29 TRINITY_DN1738_c0_g1_i1:973-3522(-)